MDLRKVQFHGKVAGAGASESNANGRFLVSARFCDAEEDADGRLLVSARFCATYANGRTGFFGIDFCATYANGRTDFFGIDWKCE